MTLGRIVLTALAFVFISGCSLQPVQQFKTEALTESFDFGIPYAESWNRLSAASQRCFDTVSSRSLKTEKSYSPNMSSISAAFVGDFGNGLWIYSIEISPTEKGDTHVVLYGRNKNWLKHATDLANNWIKQSSLVCNW